MGNTCVRVLDLVALVKDTISPSPTLKPSIFRNVALVGRNHDVEVAVTETILDTFSLLKKVASKYV